MLYLTLILIGVVLLFAYMIKEAFDNRVIKQEVYFKDFPQSFQSLKLFFISDIHRRSIHSSIIEEVKGQVDLVLIGGDLVEKGVSLERVKENIIKLKSLGPVYFVWGNNDYEVDYHMLDAILIENGVKILDNTAVQFESETGETIKLLGVDDMNLKRDRLELALKDAGEGGFKILLSHDPRIISKIKKEDTISFVLSGHTHGGQIHILGYSPYKKGSIKQYDETRLLISNGYGTTALPFRLGAKSETHLITIHSEFEITPLK